MMNFIFELKTLVEKIIYPTKISTLLIFLLISFTIPILIKRIEYLYKLKKYKYTKGFVDKIIKCVHSVVKDPKSIKQAKRYLNKFIVSEEGKHFNELFEKSNNIISKGLIKKGYHVNIHGITINDDPRTMIKFVTNIVDKLNYWDTYDLTINKKGELKRIELSDYIIGSCSKNYLKEKPLYELLCNL